MSSFKAYQTLTLNGQTYTKTALFDLAKKYLQKPETPIWEQRFFAFIATWLNEETFVQVQTSGSTGIPKQIFLEKDKMVASAKATGAFFDLKEKQTALLCLPCDYIAGKMMVVRSFVLGLNLIVVPPASNPSELLMEHNFQLATYTDSVNRFEWKQIDFAAMIPMQVATILEKKPGFFSKINQLIIGGGAINQPTFQALQNLPTHCYATYGMTETITHIAVKTLNGQKKTTDYQALENVYFSQDERNCLVIEAPYLTAERVVTNDVVTLKDDRCFEWLGRFDNIINSGGVKINPEKVEAQLQSLIPQRFFIASLPDERLENKLILVIEGEKWNKEKLHIFQVELKQQLEKYAVPKEIYFVKQFEETATGKVQRKETLVLRQ